MGVPYNKQEASYPEGVCVCVCVCVQREQVEDTTRTLSLLRLLECRNRDESLDDQLDEKFGVGAPTGFHRDVWCERDHLQQIA